MPANGELSTDRRRVEPEWQSDAGLFAMTSTERGGPPVSPANRRGALRQRGHRVDGEARRRR
jgi:hypothetical protein